MGAFVECVPRRGEMSWIEFAAMIWAVGQIIGVVFVVLVVGLGIYFEVKK